MNRPDACWLAESVAGGVVYSVFHEQGSLWVRARWRNGAAVAFSLAYALGAETRLVDIEQQKPNVWQVRLHTVAGEYAVRVELPHKNHPVLHWHTTLRPSSDLRVQAWPRDILPIGACGDPSDSGGVVYAAQRGITGNVLFASLTEPSHLARGSFLYVQDLGALTDYFEETEASANERLGGTWPELGFELPPTDRPLQQGRDYVLSDAYVCMSDEMPHNDIEMARLFLELYTCVYLKLPKPPETHRDWPRRVAETARDLWDCNYGNAKHYGTFKGLAPLQDAKYLALYEELEVLAAIHEYLALAGDDAPASLRVLLPEYCKYLIDRAWFHYPSELPRDVLADKATSGNLHRYLSVPVEDLGEGWERAGQVGQEVYGAAAPFIIATRHCHRVPGELFNLHCTYPVSELKIVSKERSGSARFKLSGDGRCEASLRIVPLDFTALPEFEVIVNGNGKARKTIAGSLVPLGYIEYVLSGDAEVQVSWNKSKAFIGSTPVPTEPLARNVTRGRAGARRKKVKRVAR